MTDVQDVVEETLETIERIPNVNLNGTTKKQQVIILGVTAVTSALVSGLVSHFITKKVLTTKFESVLVEQVAQEVDKAKHFYARANKMDIEGHPLSPQDIFEGLLVTDETAEAVRKYAAKGFEIKAEPPVATEEELMEGTFVPSVDGSEMVPEVEETHSVFEGHTPVEDDDWDLVEEIANRIPNQPFIISHDEYYEAVGDLDDWDQDELTWFDGDKVLADTQGVEVPDPRVTIGEDNLKFGHGSRDMNTVYIRNDTLKMDFEVTRSPGMYKHEVLGLDFDADGENEIRHSMRRPRKMRSTDE